jgi:hypothetical protein
MDTDLATQIANLSEDDLRPVISGVLGRNAAPTGPLAVQKIGASGGHATAGIFHVAGQAQTATDATAWSAVVKALGVPENPSPGIEYDALREVEVYRSQAFAKLCGGVRAPRCYAIQEQEGVQLLWLEDLTSAPQPPWSAQHFLATARHLGQFNAHWPAHALPTWDWLYSHDLRTSFHNPSYQDVFDRLLAQQDHPLVQIFAPRDLLPALLRLWDESDALLTQTDGMGRGVCHLDCHPRNLFPMKGPETESYTVAIDWVKVGIGSLGIDIGHLLASPLTWLDISPEEAQHLREPIYEAYLSGLRDQGWAGKGEEVRLVYLTRLMCEAIRNTNLVIHAINNAEWAATMERLSGLPIAEICMRFGRTLEFYFDCQEEALRMSKQVR